MHFAELVFCTPGLSHFMNGVVARSFAFFVGGEAVVLAFVMLSAKSVSHRNRG